MDDAFSSEPALFEQIFVIRAALGDSVVICLAIEIKRLTEKLLLHCLVKEMN